MSFTTIIKQEIANTKLKGHCQKAQLSALIQLTSSLKINSGNLGILARTESPTTAKRIIFLLKELYKVETNLQIAKKTNLKKNNVYTIEISNNGKQILEDLGLYSSRGLLSRPTYELVSKDCCAKAYLAGAFLAYGTCNNPSKTNYHLEISLNEKSNALFLIKIISRFNIEAKIVERRNRFVVYMKKADYVSDFLAIIGANSARLEFENERISRDMKNSISRIDNCEIANEVKTIKAANSQLEYINKIKQAGKYDKLPERLRNVCELRIRYQDYSLLELCDAYQKNYGDVVSKSGMKHRLNKIQEIAENLDDKDSTN
jgi:cell division protein WhiA